MLASRELDIKEHSTQLQICANAATILNMTGFNFRWLDFKEVKLLKADLSNCWLNGVDFRKANLDEVNFSQSCLDDSDISEASLKNANFGTIAPLAGHTSQIYSLAISADTKLIVSGSEDNTIRVWSLLSLKQLQVISEHSQAVMSVVISEDSKVMMSGSRDKTARIWI